MVLGVVVLGCCGEGWCYNNVRCGGGGAMVWVLQGRVVFRCSVTCCGGLGVVFGEESCGGSWNENNVQIPPFKGKGGSK